MYPSHCWELFLNVVLVGGPKKQTFMKRTIAHLYCNYIFLTLLFAWAVMRIHLTWYFSDSMPALFDSVAAFSSSIAFQEYPNILQAWIWILFYFVLFFPHWFSSFLIYASLLAYACGSECRNFGLHWISASTLLSPDQTHCFFSFFSWPGDGITAFWWSTVLCSDCYLCWTGCMCVVRGAGVAAVQLFMCIVCSSLFFCVHE